MINKNLRKSLARKNGNDILIWSCNNPLPPSRPTPPSVPSFWWAGHGLRGCSSISLLLRILLLSMSRYPRVGRWKGTWRALWKRREGHRFRWRGGWILPSRPSYPFCCHFCHCWVSRRQRVSLVQRRLGLYHSQSYCRCCCRRWSCLCCNCPRTDLGHKDFFENKRKSDQSIGGKVLQQKTGYRVCGSKWEIGEQVIRGKDQSGSERCGASDWVERDWGVSDWLAKTIGRKWMGSGWNKEYSKKLMRIIFLWHSVCMS